MADALRERPEALAFQGAANGRVTPGAPDPDDYRQMAENAGYRLDAAMIPGCGAGRLDLLFRRPDAAGRSLPAIRWTHHITLSAAVIDSVNDPMRPGLRRALATHARQACAQALPEAMRPAHIVVIDRMPTNANGKRDRAALPNPNEGAAEGVHVAAETAAERVLCAAVAHVLGLPRAGLTDNFFQLGGDSISSIRLVNQVRNCGYTVTPRDIFLHPVLGVLAGVLRPSTQAPETTRDLPDPSGPLPPTPMLRWLLAQGGPIEQFRQAVVLQAPEMLNAEALEAAVMALLDRHEMLRARLDAEGVVTLASVGSVSAASCIDWAPRGAAIDAVFAETKLDPIAGAVFKVVVLPSQAAGRDRVMLIAHHIAVDAVSWPILSEDLADAYGQATRDGGAQPDAQTDSPRAWVAGLTEDLPRWRTQRTLWQRHGGTANAGDGLAAHLSRTRDTVRTAGHAEMRLPSSVTRRLLAPTFARRGMRPDILLLAALFMAANAPGTGAARALRLSLEGHGRGTGAKGGDLSRTVGWFTALYPVTLDPQDMSTMPVDDAAAAIRVLKRVKQQLADIPDGGTGYGVLRWLDPETREDFARHTTPDFGFNYLGRVQSGATGDWLHAPERPGILGEADADWPLPHPLAINSMVHESATGPELQATLRFAPAVIGAEDVARLVERWSRALTTLAEAADAPALQGLTPGDLSGLDMSQLEIEDLEQRFPDLYDIWPLSGLQAGIAFRSAARTSNDPYHVQKILDLAGPIDPQRLQVAFAALVQRHPVLRAGLHETERGAPVFIVRKKGTLAWHVTDLSDLSEDERQERADAIARTDRETAFDLKAPPLMRAHLIRLGPTRARLVWSLHHIIADGWSGGILLRELQTIYVDGSDDALGPPAKMRDVFDWHARLDTSEAEQVWADYLSGFEPPEPLAARGPCRDVERTLPADLVTRLQALSRSYGVTMASLVQGAWGLVLRGALNRDNFCIGTIHSGRHGPVAGIERMVGFLLNTTPVRIDPSPRERVMDFIARLQRVQADLQPVQHLGLDRIQRQIGGTVVDTLFAFENFPAPRIGGAPEPGRLNIAALQGHSHSHYAVALSVVPGSEMRMRLQCHDGTIEHADVLGRLERLLGRIADAPEAPISALDLLSDAERRGMLGPRAGRITPYAVETLPALFERQAAARPTAGAVSFGAETVSYGELDAAANRVAWALIAAGAGPEDFVALRLSPGVTMIVAILGALKAGAAYVPLSPDTPPARLAAILSETRPVAAIDDGPGSEPGPDLAPVVLRPGTPGTDAKLARQRSDAPTDTDRCRPLHPDHPAYAIFTSGSTGIPKGVIATHRNVSRLLTSEGAPFEMRADDVWTMVHSYTFDFSVWEIWGPLAAGGRLVIAPRTTVVDPAALSALIARERVTVLSMTPLLFGRLMENGATAGLPDTVRVAVVGGEAWNPERLPATVDDLVLRNVYGPTESTVFATMSGSITRKADPPIGAPFANTQAFVLDASMRLCPPGTPGELYLAGPGLARCYLGRGGLTATRFVAHPYGMPGERLYRTGDLALWTEAGDLRFRGRSDDQVKLRGYRIELGEIEAALRAVEGVSQAVAAVQDDPANKPRLVAWIAGPDLPDQRSLRKSLAERLPGYMIPSVILSLTAMPLGPTGKIDRKSLPSPDPAPVLQPEQRPALSPEQALLCEIVADLTGGPTPDLDANFFDLGGDSLLVARLSAAVRNRLGRELPIQAIFDRPRLRDLAAVIGLPSDAAAAFAPRLDLRPDGTKAPLFCLYPGSGLGWPYANLLSTTPPDRPVIAVQPRALSANAPTLPTRFENVVEEALDTIRARQLDGPYCLAGWSFGGVLAHALATRLQSEGAAIERLILFDSYPMPAEAEPDYADGDVVWRDLALGAGLPLDPAITGLDAATVKAIAREREHLFGTFDTQQLHRLRDQLAINTHLLPQARLVPLKGDVTLFVATRQTADLDRSAADPALWRPFIDGRLDCVPIDAEHHQMLSPHAIRKIGMLAL